MEDEPEYVVVAIGKDIKFYERKVWESEQFRILLKGREIGRGMTLAEAIAMKQLMESDK